MRRFKIKKLTKKTIVAILLTSALSCVSQADLLEPQKNIAVKNEFQKKIDTNYFSLANIVGNILNNDKNKTEQKKDNSTEIRQKFVSATSKFNQGNATSAYEEYSNLIDKLDNDIMLLNLSKVLYKIGFFSLASKAEDKITYKNQYYGNIYDLEISYLPKSKLSQEDEIFFAKMYSSIFFDNSAHEANLELLSKKNQYQKNDYYNYLLSQSYFEQKEYHKALNYINKAINYNSENTNYKLAKIDILSSLKKYQDALNIVKKLEKNTKIIYLSNEIQIKKYTLKAQNGKNDKEKKYALAYKTFLEGNYEKTKKECLYILNFDKDNNKIISLYAKSELALGQIERANSYFIKAYKIEKNDIETLIGLGDIRYIHKDYKGAIKMYKRALKHDPSNNEILIKLALSQKDYAKDLKSIAKTKAKLDKLPQNYISYYNCAISSAQKNNLLKEEFLKQSINLNPLFEPALGEMVDLDLKNKNFKNAKGLIDSSSFTLEKNYYYYYLYAMYMQSQNKKQDAIQLYKTSLDLNPNFEIANSKLLKLIPNKNEEI